MTVATTEPSSDPTAVTEVIKGSAANWQSHTVVPVLRLTAIVAQLLYVRVYTHRLGNADLGHYFFLLTASYSLNALIFVPVDYFQQARIYPFREQSVSLKSLLVMNGRILGSAAVICLAAYLIAWFGALAGIAAIGTFLMRYRVDVLLCISLSVTLYTTTALKGLLNNLEHRTIVAVAFLLEAIAKVSAFVLIARVVAVSPAVLIGSNVAVFIVETLALLAICSRLGVFAGDRVQTPETRDVVRFSAPIAGSAVANWLQMQGYRLVLIPLGYAELVGAYGVISNIGITGMNAISVIFSQLFLPRMYSTHGRYALTYLRNALVAVAAVAVVAAIAAPILVTILTRHNLVSHAPLILYGVLTEAGNFLAGALSVALTIAGKTAPIMRSAVIGVVTCALAFAVLQLQHRVGINTVGLPMVLSQGAVLAVLFKEWRKTETAGGH